MTTVTVRAKKAERFDLDQINDAMKRRIWYVGEDFTCPGDAAVRRRYDGYENAIIRHGRGTSRHQVEHIGVIDPADIERFAKVGIMASGTA